MSTIGLDSLYYATITEDAVTGVETYGTPVALSPAMKADLSVELAEAMLYADDAAAEVVKEFKSGKISLGVQELGTAKAAALLGATVDSKGVLISAAEDVAPPVAIGFRARKSNGKYAYYWLYKVIFAVPSDSLQTKGDSISFATPTIEGTILRRNKADTSNNHPWRAFVVDGETGVDSTTITGWFTTVYEPDFTPVTPTIAITTEPAASTEVTAGSIAGSLSVVASSNTSNPVTYQWYKNTVDSSTGGTIIDGETSASFDIPTDLPADTYYYYCVLSSSGAESVTTSVATVVVS